MRKFKPSKIKIPVQQPVFNYSESDIQSTLAKILMFCGWFVVRINSGSADLKGRRVNFYEILNFSRLNKGFPDLLCIKQNQYVLIECKSTGGRLNQNQINFNQSTEKFHLNRLIIDNMDDATDIISILFKTFKFS